MKLVCSQVLLPSLLQAQSLSGVYKLDVKAIVHNVVMHKDWRLAVSHG